jgi:hypothetical protein
MLKPDFITELAKRAGLSSKVLTDALKSDKEETLTFDSEGEFIANTDLEEIKKKAGKTSYDEGKKAGEEMFIKEIRTDEKLEFEGKTKEQLLTALKAKILKDAGSEPTKRITELEADNKKLKELVTETENKLKTETETFNSKLSGIEIESTIKSKLPDKLANGLSKDDAYVLYMAKKKVEKTDAGIVLVDPITKQVIKDKKLNPVSIDDDIKTFLEGFGHTSDPGRGGGDDKTKTKTNIESFTKRSEVENYFEKNNIPLSEQSGILNKAMKNEGFKMDE